jgi:hypothetical protein
MRVGVALLRRLMIQIQFLGGTLAATAAALIGLVATQV